MKVLIIGGVAAGSKAAAKLRRQMPDAEVKILTGSSDISYAGCGLPYYVGGVIKEKSELIVNTPAMFEGLTGASVATGCTVDRVDTAAKTVSGVCGGAAFTESYDKLVIAVGASPLVPDIAGTGLPGVFTMRTPDDAAGLRSYLEEKQCRSAVVAGAGFIGLEIAENLKKQGLSVTVVDIADQIMPNVFDPEMAAFAAKHLRSTGMRIMTATPVSSILGTDKAEGILAGNTKIAGDVVVLALGIRPNTGFLAGSGIALDRGAVVVNDKMETNVPDVYAAGDCVVVRSRITGKAQRSPMGSTANISARILAKNAAGAAIAYPGVLGTGVVRLMDGLSAGRTGLTEQQARAEGYDVITSLTVSHDKPDYMPGSGDLVIKLVADKASRRLLGVQVLGSDSVDKVVDTAALGISAGLAIDDYDAVDFAYAPPFSTAIHPMTQACYVLENKLDGSLDSFTPAEYAAGAAKGYTVIDATPAHAIAGAKAVTLETLNGPVEGLAFDEKLLLCCARGRKAYLLQKKLRSLGYTNTKVLEGGVVFNTVKVNFTGAIPAAEIKRVKGLGCLQDKRFPDRFNMRVITRNGKITSEEHRAVAEAADLFGSGEVTMTTRLTLEIQGIPFDKIDAAIAFLNAHGLDAGGTGSLVRPVVSCKGTTCQYGLADTFDLSQKLHDRFYIGWHKVTLPHKFKIAVGGCPNNCVKPDLNDLGIIGQRVPQPDLSKCRGCKKCQVEAACPIKEARVIDGKLSIDPEACNHCGRCVGKCPFGALEESTYGYKVYIGGRWGKRVKEGRALRKIFSTQEEVMDLAERAILLFRDEGITGERFSDTIERLGFDYVEDKLLNGVIDKETILEKTVIGGAKC